jgi:hypothetical protein
MEQLEDNLGAVGWELDVGRGRRLSQASAIEEVYPYHFIREMQRGQLYLCCVLISDNSEIPPVSRTPSAAQ